jgi:hypothetical protein
MNLFQHHQVCWDCDWLGDLAGGGVHHLLLLLALLLPGQEED